MSTLKTNRIENLTTTDGGISINNSGNVGFANSSPTTGRVVVGSTSDSSTNVNITSSTSGTGLLSFSDTNSGQGGIRYFHSTDHMQFHTADNERMRIDSGGRVGIGLIPHTGSGYALQIDGGSTSFLQFFNDTTGNTVNDGLVIGNDSSTAYVVNKEATPLTFRTSNTERMRIDSSGNVGIGTTSPANPLHIADEFPIIRLQSDTGSYQGRNTIGGFQNLLSIDCDNDGAIANSAIAFNVDGSERMRINSSGYVGIGTNNPDKLLHVVSGGSTRTKVSTTNASSFGQMYFGDEDKYIIGYRESHSNQARQLSFKNTHSSGTITFRAGGDQERMRVQSGGGVSIGTTSSPTCLTQASALRLGNNTLGSHAFTNISTTVTNITAASGLGGLAFVQAYNTANGAQYVGLLMWRYGHVVTISENNNTGLTLNFSVSTNTLRLATSSGTVSGSVITLQAST